MEGFTVVAPTEADLLLAEANKLDVDVLCWGGTHRFDAYEYMDKFFVNPGSATGAMPTGWMADGEEMVPSFCLMDVSPHDKRVSSTSLSAELIRCPLGPRYFSHTLRLSVTQRCEWC
jgi:putative phosphoesterase